MRPPRSRLSPTTGRGCWRWRRPARPVVAPGGVAVRRGRAVARAQPRSTRREPRHRPGRIGDHRSEWRPGVRRGDRRRGRTGARRERRERPARHGPRTERCGASPEPSETRVERARSRAPERRPSPSPSASPSPRPSASPSRVRARAAVLARGPARSRARRRGHSEAEPEAERLRRRVRRRLLAARLLLGRRAPSGRCRARSRATRPVEPHRELGGGRLGAVRGVDEVLGGLEREVAADRAGRRLVRAGRAVDRAHDRDRVRPLERERDERRRDDEVDQAAEERLLAVDRVMAFGQRPVDLDELQADELEPALLVALEDPADEQALDAIGLDEDECAFGHDPSRRSGDAGSLWSVAVGGARVFRVGPDPRPPRRSGEPRLRGRRAGSVATDEVEGGALLIAGQIQDGRREGGRARRARASWIAAPSGSWAARASSAARQGTRAIRNVARRRAAGPASPGAAEASGGAAPPGRGRGESARVGLGQRLGPGDARPDRRAREAGEHPVERPASTPARPTR